MEENEIIKLKKYAIFLLSRKDYSIYKLKQKLTLKSENSTDIEKTINWLKTMDYLNDDRFAELILNKYSKIEGKIKIELRLKENGIPKEVISATLAEYNNELNKTILENKFNEYKKEDENKYWGFLLRKGFTPTETKKIIQAFKEMC